MEFYLKSGRRIYLQLSGIAWALVESEKGGLKLYHPTHNNGGWPLADHYEYEVLLQELNSID